MLRLLSVSHDGTSRESDVDLGALPLSELDFLWPCGSSSVSQPPYNELHLWFGSVWKSWAFLHLQAVHGGHACTPGICRRVQILRQLPGAQWNHDHDHLLEIQRAQHHPDADGVWARVPRVPWFWGEMPSRAFARLPELHRNVCHRPCVSQVPSFKKDQVMELEVEVQGDTFYSKEARKVMIKSFNPASFIQTDKPIYLPGQTGNL